MIVKTWVIAVLFASTIILSYSLLSIAAENPKGRIGYWQKNYTELKPADDPRAAKAREIFKRVLNASGRRTEKIPMLFIFSGRSSLAEAIPDGNIIMSQNVLDICYKEPQHGDDRLAFILGHEIAHLSKGDFWHMKFAEAVELSREKDPEKKEALDQVMKIAEPTADRLAKEEQADVEGIIYASMAGFDTRAIVTEDRVNFFGDFYKSLGIETDSSHPTAQQRAEAVKVRLRQVIDKVELFNLGIMFYEAGDYDKAALFFEEFLRYFPSREVYHNLAASYHQLALKYYRDWKGEKGVLPFKLSFSIDPETLAERITLKGGESPEELFNRHIGEAIEYYKKAISFDPTYIYSYNNLGCAYILRGDVDNAKAALKNALKINPNFAEALNNLGVAFFYDENQGKAKEYLAAAYKLAPSYDAPLFNLGRIAYDEKNESDAKNYWKAYLKLDSYSSWTDLIHKTLSIGEPVAASEAFSENGPENILGLKAGDYRKEAPLELGEAVRTTIISIEEEPLKITVYSKNVITLSQGKTMVMVIARDGFKGKSLKGTAVGDLEKEVTAKYGRPSNKLDTTRGKSLVYKEQRIAFQLRDGKVVSWLLF